MSAFRAWFVTGTDTEIGKTFAACTLIHAARAQGYTALGMKPVASGAETIDGKTISEDAARLLAAGSFDPGLERLNPYCLRAPVSPHFAAQTEDIRIETARIRQAFDELAQRCERLFVEGAGGFLTPLGEEVDAPRIAHELDLPIILVVGMRLGCINHALLTAEAIYARSLRLEGWIANCMYPDTPRLNDNIDFLRHRLGAPLLGTLPCAPDATPESLAHLVALPHQPISHAARSRP
ncbi:MAG: dethiobiotin synthase [Betaproteobacteria bacterium]|nr:dethiobiotin synthase [Betaproteobacteria bacterium]